MKIGDKEQMADQEPLYSLPVQGSSYEDVIARVRELKAGMTSGQRGKLASTTFQGQEEMQKVLHEAFVEFMDWNGLFSFQEASAAKMENEVLDICIDTMNGGEQGRANLTVGGTESNFSGLQAMRKWARENRPEITAPEIVAPYSTHSTVHKTAKYLDLKVVTVPQLEDLGADVEGIAAAIGPNTIGIVGSAPNWPYGTVDPIEEFEFRHTGDSFQGEGKGVCDSTLCAGEGGCPEIATPVYSQTTIQGAKAI